MKRLLGLAMVVNFLISFYNWGIYAHNADISDGQISGYNSLLKSNGDVTKTEKEKLLIEAKSKHTSYLVSRKEWLIKLFFDFGILLIFIVFYFRNNIKFSLK